MRSRSRMNYVPRTFLPIGTAVLLVALFASACASEDRLSGTWTQTEGTTALPPELGGGDLEVDATLTFDGTAEPEKTFDLHLELAFSGLSDTVDAHGTYVESGSQLTLTITGFTIDPASGNTASVSEEDGAQCIVLQGFGGAAVCFPAPQTNAFTVSGETLTMIIDQAIAGSAASQTHMSLTLAP